MLRLFSLRFFKVAISFTLVSASGAQGAKASARPTGVDNCGVKVAEKSNAQIREAFMRSAKRFRDYFDTMRGIFQERDYIVDLMERAVLSQEGLLLVGPPGNAKSLVADILFKNIREVRAPVAGRPSYFKLPLHSETTRPDIYGPLNPKLLLDTGEQKRNYNLGILSARSAFLDEIFDVRRGALRHLLMATNERADATGMIHHEGILETFIGASNKYMPRVYLEWGDQAQAVLDRFLFCAFVPGELEFEEAYIGLRDVTGLRRKFTIPDFSWADLDLLRVIYTNVRIPDHVVRVLARIQWEMRRESESLEQSSKKEYTRRLRNFEEPPPPYRATKFQSPRTFGKALSALKAKVALDWIRNSGKRELVVDTEDLVDLAKVFTLNGPSPELLAQMASTTGNEEEASQINTVQIEGSMFAKHHGSYFQGIDQIVQGMGLNALLQQADGALHGGDVPAAIAALRGFLDTQVLPNLPPQKTKTRVSAATIQYLALRQVEDVLSTAIGQLENPITEPHLEFDKTLLLAADYKSIPKPSFEEATAQPDLEATPPDPEIDSLVAAASEVAHPAASAKKPEAPVFNAEPAAPTTPNPSKSNDWFAPFFAKDSKK